MKQFYPISLLFFLTIGLLAACQGKTDTAASQRSISDIEKRVSEKASAFNADSAFAFIEAQCAFGPRTPNSAAHDSCGNYLAAKFRSYGLTVTEQRTTAKGWDGAVLNVRNIIASYRPEEAARRIVLCAHWDCRPWADNDENEANHRTVPVMGANDGASGIAILLETARQLPTLLPDYGIDLICFDAEDYGAPDWATATTADGTNWCLGSQYWAKNPHRADYTARFGILFDMVGGHNACFRYEGYSLHYASELVAWVWGAARTAGHADSFSDTEGGYILDDHVFLNLYARIPTIDIIATHGGEQTFPATWHTVNDTPENISTATLRAVGQTLFQFLSTLSL